MEVFLTDKMGSASKSLRIKERQKKKEERNSGNRQKGKHCRRFLMPVSTLAYCNQERAQKRGAKALLGVKAEALQ